MSPRRCCRGWAPRYATSPSRSCRCRGPITLPTDTSSPAALQRLLTWLSPAFPVGSFAWSQGLETAIADRRVGDGPALREWIAGSLSHGALKTDAILLAHSYRSEHDTAQLQELADLGLALSAASERHQETALTGETFAIAARAWPSDVFTCLPLPCPYPVAVGAIAGAQQIGLEATLIGYLTAAAHSQVSVAVRLVPLGQTAGLQVMAALEPLVAERAVAAANAGLDAIGGIAYAADIAQMRHETLGTRIFRS